MKKVFERLLRRGATSPEVIALAGGLPADAQFPRRALSASFLRAVRGSAALQYGWPEGHATLREQIARRLTARGARVGPDDILVTNGAQQAIALACELVCKPGDEIAVDPLTYPAALELFRGRGLRPSAEGRGRVAYVMPVVGNPTGLPLDDGRRANLAADHGRLLIEDDAYADLRFAGPAGPPLLAEARERTFHVGTLSKVLCPGLRVGWLVLPPGFRDDARKLKETSDLQSGGLAQAIASDFLAHADFERYLARLRHFYAQRARRLLAALSIHAPAWRVQAPRGGFTVWVETAARAPEETLLSAALREGVSFDPGSSFRAEATEVPLAFRLCYSAADPGRFDEAIRRLVRAWRKVAALGTRDKVMSAPATRSLGGASS